MIMRDVQREVEEKIDELELQRQLESVESNQTKQMSAVADLVTRNCQNILVSIKLFLCKDHLKNL